METTIIVTCCDLQAVAKLESGPQRRISHLGLGVLRILFSDNNQGSSEQQLVLLLFWCSHHVCPQKNCANNRKNSQSIASLTRKVKTIRKGRTAKLQDNSCQRNFQDCPLRHAWGTCGSPIRQWGSQAVPLRPRPELTPLKMPRGAWDRLYRDDITGDIGAILELYWGVIGVL